MIKTQARPGVRLKRTLSRLRAYTMVFALASIWIFFASLSGNFLSSRNLSNLFLQTSVTAILAVGMVSIIVAGHIDLSIGAIVGLTGGIAAILQVWFGWPTWLVIPVVLLFGCLMGLIQGWWVAFLGVPAFIVTLGGMMVMRGTLMGLARGTTIAPMNPSFSWIGKSYLPPSLSFFVGISAAVLILLFAWLRYKERLRHGRPGNPIGEIAKASAFALLVLLMTFALASYRGFPVPLVLVAGLAFFFNLVSTQTPFGRQIYAIGGNIEAAILSGIPVKRFVMSLFLLNGLMGALAAIVLTARVDAATISAGQMYELDAIAACVIGGTSLMGGSGTIPGALVGALVMASLDNGMSLLNLDTFWQYVVKGAILVLAVTLDIQSRKKRS